MRNALRVALLLGLVVSAGSCRPPASAESMNQVAEAYVKLGLSLGHHDPDYVDAYYGAPEWRARAESLSLDTIRTRAGSLLAQLGSMEVPRDSALTRLRRGYLIAQLGSMVARAEQLGGRSFGFDEEARAIYDVVVPTRQEADFQATLDSLASVLPGRGDVGARYQRFRQAFVVPPARIDTVFKAAVAACRERTAARMSLPPGETFTIEYVTDKPWSAYNWYQGNFRSVIQVNTELPFFIDRALDLGCHEGYPGHHVYNAMLEKELVRGRGWVEYSLYPLFSAQSLIAEGSANYGIEMAFPGEAKTAFERDVLYPLAGLDAARAGEYARVEELVGRLSYASNEAARRLLDGAIDSVQAVRWLERYGLYDTARAAQRVRFIRKYRSYVINYNLGRDVVARYVEREGADHDSRWRAFAEVLSSPRWPGNLVSRP